MLLKTHTFVEPEGSHWPIGAGSPFEVFDPRHQGRPALGYGSGVGSGVGVGCIRLGGWLGFIRIRRWSWIRIIRIRGPAPAARSRGLSRAGPGPLHRPCPPDTEALFQTQLCIHHIHILCRPGFPMFRLQLHCSCSHEPGFVSVFQRIEQARRRNTRLFHPQSSAIRPPGQDLRNHHLPRCQPIRRLPCRSRSSERLFHCPLPLWDGEA